MYKEFERIEKQLRTELDNEKRSKLLSRQRELYGKMRGSSLVLLFD